MRFLLLFLLLLAIAPEVKAQGVPAGCTSTTCTGTPLPSGFLTVSGDQFVAGGNVTVRLACTTFSGGPNDGTMPAIRAAGFNCIRLPWRDAQLTGATVNGICGTLAQIQTCAANAHTAGLAVVLSHQGNEIPAANSPCIGRQQNGLWFDSGGSSGNDDGCNDGGTITYATFKTNTVNLLTAFAGNSTVIGYELHHEPLVNGVYSGTCSPLCTNPPINWGNGGDTDILAACKDVGAAVITVNSGVILFCPGPINNGSSLLSGQPISGNPHPDLSMAAARPAVSGALTASKVAYSIDEFPNSVSGYVGIDNGATAITAYNTFWGSLLKSHTVPVMAFSIGCACDGTVGASADDNAWATTFTQYANGIASNGPSWPTSSQPMSTSWYGWGFLAPQNPNGTLLSDLVTLNTFQDKYWSTLLFQAPVNRPPPPVATTWNPNDSTGITLSNNSLSATISGAGPLWGVRSTTSKSSGKYCWEVTANTLTGSWATGVASSSWTLGQGGTPNAIQFVPSDTQTVFYNNVALTNGGTDASVSGETMAECADFGAQLLWVTSTTMRTTLGAGSWNNSNACDPTNAACGLSFSGITAPYFLEFDDEDAPGAAPFSASFSVAFGPNTSGVATLNTSTMASVALPSGFQTWDAGTSGRPFVMILGANDNFRPANDNILLADIRSDTQ